MNQILKGIILTAALAFGSSNAADLPKVTAESIAAKYGKPDKIDSTEKDKPRPPIVTKMVEYKKQHVKFVLAADAPMNTPPPYNSWVLMGVLDTATQKPITLTEADNRLAKH